MTLSYTDGLRPHQREALKAIESAMAAGRTRMRIIMTQGSGKSTVIAYVFARSLESGYARQPLYLTDRSSLAHQMAEVL